jgi:hypothetical protein
MDITKLSLTELKALAYDQLVEQERTQKNLTAINKQIDIMLKEEKQNESSDKKAKEKEAKE